MKYFISLLVFLLVETNLKSQDINKLINQVKSKLEKINRYEANGTMKTTIAYLKIPIAKVKVYFKKPNEISIQSNSGVTFIPKGVNAISLQNILSNDFTVIDGGRETVKQKVLRVIKLLPNSSNSNIVLSTVYINETDLVVEKSSTTTKEEGTYEMEMQYGKYIQYGLPDKLIFTFNAKDYKIPKGLTLDFDNSSRKNEKVNTAMLNKGKAEIVFQQYKIN
ncbi:MAG: hypothetical protein ACO3AW_01025 [Chitinophagaceae bacterium]